ncbi:hypothetical protein L1887_24743 [Cichorium endivia]|nr:hypothetical protein L1887_24743 [Cichorium endivia]
MYRHSPIRNPRSKGIKFKNVLQVCLLLAVCFWLIFQVKRSHDKKKEFENTKKEFDNTKISLNSNDEIVKLGRKDLQPKLDQEVDIHEEQDEEQIEEEKDDGGGGGDDEIDEHEQEKSDIEVDREESEVINDENETENGVSVDDHEEDKTTTIHTHEGREEQYKADDASSAVTHLNTENITLENSNEEIINNSTSLLPSLENGPPSSTTIIASNLTESLNVSIDEFAPKGSSNSSDVVESENLEGDDVIEGTEDILEDGENEGHLEEKEVRMDLETLPEIETEGGDSEDTAAER